LLDGKDATMTGSATISVEIELGWGFHDYADPYDVPELSDDGEKEREALDWFLSVCDDAGVPVTFDVVGHLLLSSCDGDHDGPHPDGWFDRDPGTDAETDPLFYFPEAVEKIRDAEVDHEVCTHTFSHVMCDEVRDEVLDWEFGRVSQLHDDRIVSLVPPRHRKPSYDVLRRNGIEVVRLATDDEPPSNQARRYVWNLTRDHPLDSPTETDGVVETRSSPFMTLTASYLSSGVSSPHPAYRVIPRRLRQRTHERFLLSGLDAASRENSHIHYWTHLYNMSNEAQRKPIRRFVETLGSRERIEKKRMAELAE
jgi:hypothetical protein